MHPMRVCAFLWISVGLLAIACSSGDTTGGNSDLVLPTISGLPGEFLEVAPGETVSITLTLTNQGVPATNYSFVWETTIEEEDGQLQLDSPGAGLERLVFVPNRIGVFQVEGLVMVPPTANLDDENALLKRTPTLTIQVRGGECSKVIPDVDEVVLAVDEIRPVSVEALALLPEAQQSGKKTLTITDESLVYAMEDDTVASVDGKGFVTGLSTGETQLKVTCGEAEVSIPVSVTEGILEAPGMGRHPIITRQTRHFAGDLAGEIGDVQGRLVHDSKGFPLALVQPAGGILTEQESSVKRLLVAQWTGTGFGTEELGTPWMSKRYPHLAFGGAGDLFVTWLQEDILAVKVARREGSDPGADWEIRSLPIELSLDDSEVLIPGSEEGARWSTANHLAVAERPNDGVWLVYNVFGDSPEDHASRHCQQKLRLVQVRATGFEAEDVFSLDIPAADNGPDGCVKAFQSTGIKRLFVRQAKSTASRPEIWALEGDTGLWQINRYTFDGNKWGREAWVDPEEYAPQESARAEPLDFVLAPVPDSPDEVGVVWVAYHQAEHDEVIYWPKGLPHNHNWRTWFPLVEDQNQYLYAMNYANRTYLGDRNVGPLMGLTSRGTLVWEDPAWSILPESTSDELEALRSYSAVSGYESVSDGLSWLVDGETRGVDYLRVVMPSSLSPSGHETDGVRLSDDPLTPTFVGTPRFDVQGVRHFLVDVPEKPEVFYVPYDGSTPIWPEVGPTLMSSIPGEGVERVTEGLEGLSVSILVGAPFESKEKLFAIEQWDDAFQVKRQSEGVWETMLESQCNGSVLSHAVTTTGALFVFCAPVKQGDDRNFQLWFTPKILKGVTWNDLGGAPDGYQGPNYTNGNSVALLTDGNEVTSVALLKGPGSWYAQIRTYNDDGIIISESLQAISDIFLPHTAAIAADGSIVALDFVPTENGYQWFTVRSADNFATVNRKIFGDGTYGRPAPLVRLPDDRLVMASDMRVSSEIRRAFYMTSDDNGATWSQPVWIRPQGGADQRVLSLTVAPDGGLVVLLQDNGSTRTWENNDIDAYYPSNAINDVAFPVLESGFVRIETP